MSNNVPFTSHITAKDETEATGQQITLYVHTGDTGHGEMCRRSAAHRHRERTLCHAGQ